MTAKCFICDAPASYVVNNSLWLCDDCYEASEYDINDLECEVEYIPAECGEEDDDGETD